MGTFAAASVVVWLFVSGYVAWLGVRQNRLDARVGDLESQMEQTTKTRNSIGRAASLSATR